LRTAEYILAIAGSAPRQMQTQLDDARKVDDYLDGPLARNAAELDADDLIYQIDSSRDYDPSPRLGTITAAVEWVNSADDFINPPELKIAEREAPRLKRGRFALLPISSLTHGHGTHTWAAAWKRYLAELLARS
jgi:homoserine O-acetyltransferase